MKPTVAKMELLKLTCRNHGWRKTATYFLVMLLVCTTTCVQAKTYYFTGTSDYADYTDVANWLVGGPEGTAATALPGPDDTLYTLSSIYADMSGGDYSVGKWGFSADWDHSPSPLYVKNGTLRITNDLTTHNGRLVMSDGGNIYVEGTYTPAIWDGGAHVVEVNDGCKYGITGTYQLYKTAVTIRSGGEFLFQPTSFSVYGGSAQNSFYDIYGTMDAPAGVKWASGSLASDSCTIDFRLRDGGLMRLGAGFVQIPSTGKLKFSWYDGGTLAVTGAVSFVNAQAVIADNATVALDVANGGSIDFTGMSIGTGVAMTKTGAGDFAYASGMTLPDTFTVSEGSLLLSSAGSYDISGVTFDGGTVKVGAAGVTLTAWDPSLLTRGGIVSGVAAPVVGATLFTCADASVLDLAKRGLNATLPDGFAVTENGNDLVVTSAYVFESTTVTDLNDPAGWAGGSVPVGKVVTIKGAGVAPTTTALADFAGITIMDGASLTIANGGTLPAITLSDSASLTVASGTLAFGSSPAITPVGANRPSVTIASGATLEVPGGTIFTDCSLSLAGTLAVTTTGDLVLGYAANGAMAAFGLSINGGTISTSAGNVNFFCPASGGTVSALGPISVKNATFTHTNDYGFNFGVNNPTSDAIAFTFDNTTLNYPKRGYYTIAGGVVLSFVNGASLWRDNNQNDKFTLTVSGLARICLGAGTSSLIGESSNSGGSVGNGFMSFSPDVDGFASLVISNATWETYHSAGNGKAVAEVYGASVHTINQNNYNRVQPFDGFKAVNLNAGALLTITNNIDSASLDFTEKFTGAGSLMFSTRRSTTRTFNFKSETSTATGTLSADPAKNDALVIASTGTWGGTVVWNGKASINHSATADDMTFGGIDLATDFTIRIWGDGNSDHYALTGAGFLSNGGKIVIAIVDGSEASQGDSWIIARIPVGTAVPTTASSSWTITSQAVEGDDSVVDLVLTPVVSDFVFNSTEYSDLCAADGWSCGYVPTNENVKVAGAGVVATIPSAATFPAFGSISVRNGATLKVLADVTLPPLTLDSTAKVLIGDDENAVSATLNASLIASGDTTVSPVALPVIEVATNASLAVASGMKFKNVDFRLYGTVTKYGTDAASPTFGYADNGETSYIAFTADGGIFDFHSNQTLENGSVSVVCPAAGGTVVPVGTIVLRNSRRQVNGWADFGNWEFGRNNPTNTSFDVLVDGTALDCAAYFYASGAAHLMLVNGACVRRNSSCLGHYFSQAIQDSATISVGEGCYIDFTTGDGSFGIDSQSAVDTVTVRDGGAYTVSYNSSGWGRGVFVGDGGILGVGKLYSARARTDLLQGFGSSRLDGDLAIASVNIGTGNKDWDRHTKMANLPFSGTGDIVITNGVPAYPFTVTMVNGANTATGSIKVAKAAGDAETALYFANGANWAGTVVAGNVALTNLTDGAAAASVTFGTIALPNNSTFPVRMWSDGAGGFAGDTVDVGLYVNGGGRLTPVNMTGAAFAFGDTIVVGKIAKTSPLPRAARGWYAEMRPIVGDDNNGLLVLIRGKGLQVILR